MEFKSRTIKEIAEMIYGYFKAEKSFFRYRSSKYLTEFFQDCGTDHCHDGSSRSPWVSDALRQILAEPSPGANAPPETFARVIRTLMDPGDAVNEGPERSGALALLNTALAREGFDAFYGPDKQCYMRHLGTGAVAGPMASPHRPFTESERRKRELLTLYLEGASEDELIADVLLPLCPRARTADTVQRGQSYKRPSAPADNDARTHRAPASARNLRLVSNETG